MEALAGALLMVLTSADLFITVLYARIGTGRGNRLGLGLSGRWLMRGNWELFRWLGDRLPGRTATWLSLCGPFTLVCMVATWSVLLTTGAALMLHPLLGREVLAQQGRTPTDFSAALYAAGTSLSLVGAGGYVPQSAWARMLFLLNSITGASALTLTLNYLMQIYQALQRRNALGLKVHLMTQETGDAAALVIAWGPRGHFATGYTTVAELAGELAEVQEAHHLYPLLFYYRFTTPYPNLLVYLAQILEAATLVRSLVARSEQHAWLADSAAMRQLWHGGNALARMLEHAFLPHEALAISQQGSKQAAWARRFHEAAGRLAAAGLSPEADEAAERRYRELRAEWDGRIQRLGRYLGHNAPERLCEGVC